MPISQTNQLFSLIKSLTRSEKRHFRLHVNRISDSNSKSYVQLFDCFDKQKEVNEAEIFKKIKGLNKVQFSNLKRQLYGQIMSSLEQVHKQKRADLQIRELLNFANILYGKGLYMQSLKLLQKAKVKAERSHYDLHYMSILEFEKKIQSRHITRSGADHSLELGKISEVRNEQIWNTIKLSNLRLLMHNLYIKNGHIKSKEEAQVVMQLFESKTPQNIDEKCLNVKEKSYLYQAFVWYYFILLDFETCYHYAFKWVNLFKEETHLTKRDPDLLMRGYHYLLACAYNTDEKDKYLEYLAEVEAFRKQHYASFNNNSQMMSFIYVHNGRLNRHFLEGSFEKGLEVVPRTLRRIQRYQVKLDAHRIMIFYYKIAWMYFGAEQANNCLEYLQKIINMDVKSLAPHFQVYTRLMYLMAHYELENEEIMPYLLQTTEVFLKKLGKINELQRLCLDFFKKIAQSGAADRQTLFLEFEGELNILKTDFYKRRMFLYLDIPAWVRAKITQQSLAKLIQERGN